MTFIVRRGSFAKSTAGAPVSQTIDSGSGEEIKFIRVWTERQVGVGFADGDIGHSEGWSDGVNEGCVSIAVEDGVGTSDASRRQTSKLLSCVDHDQTLLYEGSITGFGTGIDAGKFTVQWTTNNALADEIYYEVFCGSNIANVKIGTFASALVAGNQSITGVGFVPNYLNVWSTGTLAALPKTEADASYSIGDAVSPSKRNGIAMYVDEGVQDTITTQTDLLIRTLTITGGMGGGASVLEDIDFVSFDADGWKQNMIVADSDAIIYGFLAVEFVDVNIDIGDFLEPTTNTTVNVPTSNQSVQEVKVRTQARVETATIINDSIVKQMLGAGTYANNSQGTTGFFYDHSGGTTDNENSGSSTLLMRMFEAQTTLVGDAELIAQTVLTDFRLTWTNTDGTQRDVLYTAFSFGFHNEEFSVDAIVVDRFDNDFTVDAILKIIVDNDFTVDAFVRATQDFDFDVDSILVVRNPHTFSLDGIIVNRFDDDSLVDAFLLATQDLDFVVDANVQLATSTSFEADSLLQDTFTDTFEVDAIIPERFDLDFDVDAFILETKTHTFEADAIIQRQNIDNDFTVDAIVQETKDNDFSVDAFIQALGQTLDFIVDANVQLATSDSFEIDALVQGTKTDTFSVDARIRQQQTNDFSVDAKLAVRNLFTVDAVLVDRPQNDFTVDAFVQTQGETDTFLVDAFVELTKTTTFEVDAIFKVVQTLDFVVDANVQKATSQNWENDALLQATQTEDFDVDAVLVDRFLNTFSVDAFFEEATQNDFSVDAFITAQFEHVFRVDAFFEEATKNDFTVDAIIRGQKGLPDEDISNAGAWVPQIFPTLFQELDNLAKNPGQFIRFNGGRVPDITDTFEVGLNPMGDPGGSTGHVITVVLRASSIGPVSDSIVKVRLKLFQDGTTLIATTPFFTSPSPSSFTTFQFILSGAEADAITNYMTLSIRGEPVIATQFEQTFSGDAILT